jgi:hypothetical protein
MMGDQELIREIEGVIDLMISVATGGPRIDDVRVEYQRRRERIAAGLGERSLIDPNPYDDLWKWYGKWHSGDLPSYQSRRLYLADIYQPLLGRLRETPRMPAAVVFEDTGWTRVDRAIGEIRRRLEEAQTEEQFQTIGLLCREIMISLAQSVYDSTRHVSDDGIPPSATDTKCMLEAYLSVELGGRTNETARRHARSALDLANELQHRRTADFRSAALCSEATSSVINLIAIISGRRDP